MRLRTCWPLLGLIFFVGCPSSLDSLDPPGATDATAVADDPTPVEVTIAPWSAIERAITSRQGKVVVVDLWSNTCAPCLREFPHLVELHNHYGEDVACIGVNLDYYGAKTEPPESYRPAVVEYLTEQRVTFKNFLCSDTTDDALAKANATSMPTVLVYNRAGELVKMFEEDGSYGEDGFSYAKHIGPLVEQLTTDGS